MQELTNIKLVLLCNIPNVVNIIDDYHKEYNSLDVIYDCAVSNNFLVTRSWSGASLFQQMKEVSVSSKI